MPGAWGTTTPPRPTRCAGLRTSLKHPVVYEALPSTIQTGRCLQVGVHERFLRDELDVVVATVAFGMGAPAFGMV